MDKQIAIEDIQQKLKEIENKDIEEFFSEVDGTFSIMFAIGFKCGQKAILKELIEKEKNK